MLYDLDIGQVISASGCSGQEMEVCGGKVPHRSVIQKTEDIGMEDL